MDKRMLLKGFLEVLVLLILPAKHQDITLKGCYDEVGDLGLERMLDLMLNHFFCPRMAVQAKEHVDKHCQCIMFKAKPQGSLMESLATHPLELVHTDYMFLEENVLVVTYHFTQYVQAYVTWSQTAQVTAKA